MARLRVAWAILVLVALGALISAITGCSPVRQSPDKAIASATAAIGSTKSMTYAMDMKVESGGQTIPVAIKGVVRAPGDSKVTVETTISGKTSSVEQVIVNGVMYVKYPLSDEWGATKLNIASTAPGQGSTPSSYLAFLESFSSVDDLGTEKVAGVECYHYSLDVARHESSTFSSSNQRRRA